MNCVRRVHVFFVLPGACDASFTSEAKVVKHFRDTHDKKRDPLPFACRFGDCSSAFLSTQKLKAHQCAKLHSDTIQRCEFEDIVTCLVLAGSCTDRQMQYPGFVASLSAPAASHARSQTGRSTAICLTNE